MDKLSQMKKSYESIKAPEGLYDKISGKIIKMEKRRAIWRKCSGIAACFALFTVVSACFNPDIAHAVQDVPIVGDIVNVITGGRYVIKDDRVDVEIVTPEIKGLLDKETEEALNNAFKENADALIAAVEKDIADMKEQFGDLDMPHMGIQSDYIIKTDNENILAIDMYILNVVGSSSTVHQYYTIDKNTREILEFKDLFKEGYDYKTAIDEYIKYEINRRNSMESGLYYEDGEFAFSGIDDDQKFYINDDGLLVICFDKYEIAAGAQGSPEFVIPKEVSTVLIK